MTGLWFDPPTGITPTDSALWRAIAPTLTTTVLQPVYLGAFENFIKTAGAYFRLRAALARYQRVPTIDVSDVEREVREYRRLVMLFAADFGLRPRKHIRARDVVDDAADDYWLARLFDIS